MTIFGAVCTVVIGLQQGGSVTLATQKLEAPPQKVRVDGQRVSFEQQKLAVRIPLGWQRLAIVGQSAGLLASFAPLGTSGATLALSFSEDSGRSRLPDNLPATIALALAKRYPGFQQTAKQRLTLAGADAWLLDGQLKQPGQSALVRNRQVYICRQGRIYVLTLTSKKEDFERLVPSLERLLKSIEWLPSQ
ncbi:LpqN/LpqT family lipoprotein [Armatimonas sp.]|uniref:LpqN/LpqT family lipoprotein n=1 Tax=Armatimonas sp. TaxID=1872638 RepID=UPI00286AAF33|nr:LpqN/LpqT family lipoprotein [Armatimonas sp.]